ncbi:MAG: DUF4236 domain-containing protein [Pyrinomonadaceae bacterium]
MGFFFRKSIKFGPMRLNFSKGGIGISAGVKGARVSTGPRGTYIHAGRHGFYYSQRIGGSYGHQPASPKASPQPQVYTTLADNAYVIGTADVSRLVETSSAKLLNEINARSRIMRSAPFALLATIGLTPAVFFAAPFIAAGLLSIFMHDRNAITTISTVLAMVAGLATAVVGGIFTWSVHREDMLRRTTPMFYELTEDALARFTAIQQAFNTLSRSNRIWRVRTQRPNFDWKRNAGASSILTRQVVAAGQMSPPYIATNVDIFGIRLDDSELYFMPDYVLVRQRNQYGAVSYASLNFSFVPTRFIEDGGVPRDARVVDHTWQYVNKNGGPDRRFSNNRQLPIAQYGLLELQSGTGLNIHIHVSNLEAATYFADGFNRVLSARPYKQPPPRPNTSRPAGGTGTRKPEPTDGTKSAYEILGLDRVASAEQITMAYRQMAKMYHPDRLANLAPEFIALAEERMKEINAAYAQLKKPL